MKQPKLKTFEIALPKILASEVEDILAQRSMTMSEYVAVALRAMPKDATVLYLDTLLPFGKYRGETVEMVTRADPAYIIWMSENVGRVRIADNVTHLANELVDPPMGLCQ